MGAICAKCCLCYCFKLSEFGERFRCCSCCRQCCGQFCQCGDCCDVDEEDVSPFIDANGETKEGMEALVYPNGDKYIGQLQNNHKHGYGELIRMDGTRLKGYFVEDEFVGAEMSEAAKATREDDKDGDQVIGSSAKLESTISQGTKQYELLPVT